MEDDDESLMIQEVDKQKIRYNWPTNGACVFVCVYLNYHGRARRPITHLLFSHSPPLKKMRYRKPTDRQTSGHFAT